MSEEQKECRDKSKPNKLVAWLMSPKDVSMYWNAVVSAVVSGLPKRMVDADTPTNIMAAIMSGGLDCWALLDVEQGRPPKFVGAGTTAIAEDKWLKRRSLVIYSLHSARYVTAEAWKSALEPVVEHAKENGCSRVIAYTDNPRAIQLANLLGFTTGIQAIEMEV